MEIDNIIQTELTKKIKQNKKYKSLSDDIIKKEIIAFQKKFNSDLYDEKFAMKKIRKELHRIYSSYQTKGKRKRNILLSQLDYLISSQAPKNKILETTNKILSTTLSTKERLPNYKTIYKQIFKITGNPKTIIDLGSGLNPTSYPYMNLTKLTYHSCDIDLDDIKFLNNYFKIMKNKGLSGNSKELDIRDINKLKQLPKSDLILMFKTYDIIVPKNKKLKKIGELIIKTLIKNTKYLVISFATKTLTRKSMNLPRRIGFEMMLDRNRLKYEPIKTDNEIYYVVSNPNV